MLARQRPSRRKPRRQLRCASASARSPHRRRPQRHRAAPARGASIIIASRSIPAAQPTAGVCGPPSALDQPVVAPAGDHRALRAQPVGDELERGVAVIIEAAHQPRRRASRRRPAASRPAVTCGEEIARLRRSDNRRSPARCRRSACPAGPCCRGCAAGCARAASRLSSDRSPLMRAEMLDQRRAPGLAGLPGRRAC